MSTKIAEEFEEEAVPEEIQEYIGITEDGTQALEDLQDATEEERLPYPGLFESLDFLDRFNRAADAVGHQPIRTKEDLLDWFSQAGLSADAFLYAAGKNPEGKRYISWFKDRPGEFAPTKEPRQNLVQDKKHHIRNLLSKNPLSDRDMNKLTEEETQFLDKLRTPEGPKEAISMRDMQKAMVEMIRKFHTMPSPKEYYQHRDAGGLDKEDALYKEKVLQEMESDYKKNYYRAQNESTSAIDFLDKYHRGVLSTPLDAPDKKFIQGVRQQLEEQRTPQKRPFSRELTKTLYQIAYPPKDEPELWKDPDSVIARKILESGRGIIPDENAGEVTRHDVDPRKSPFFFHGGEPFPSRFWEEREQWMPAKKKWTREIDSSTLRLDKKSDTTGPGGEDWSYEFTSGPTPTKDTKERRKHRFPFHNRPSGDLAIPGGSEQGNFINSKPGVQNMDSLEATIDGMIKTADNDLFETHSFESGNGPWITFTLFKRAHSKFKKGDVVVQHGKSVSDIKTYRRRYGTLMAARRNFKDIVTTVFAVNNPGTSTPSDSFHEVQTGPFKGPYTKRNDYDHPERGPREGFTRPVNRRDEDTKRNIFPYEDQEVSNQTSIFGTGYGEDGKKKKDKKPKKAEVGNYAAPVVETPEERAGTIEQDLPKPINWDPKRPFPNKRKRVDNVNETGLLDKPSYQRHDRPLQNF